MSINNGLMTQLLSMQQLPTQRRFKSHGSPGPPQTQRLPSNLLIENASVRESRRHKSLFRGVSDQA